jgi:hypothetical protein
MNSKFINISNHPSTEWGNEQLKMAYEIADEIVDISFPAVDPAESDAKLRQLCSEIVFLLESLSDNNTLNHSVHVMGEMRLTFLIVKTLQANGYRCYASAGLRDVSTLKDGRMIRKFRFHSFKEYLV